MTDTTPTPDPIAAAVANLQPPGPDPDRMREIAADWQRTLDDPEGVFARSPERRAEVAAAVAVLMARHGIDPTPPPETPQERAARELDAAFPSIGNELEPAVAGILMNELDRLAALPPAELERRTDALRAELGAASHAELVARAKSVEGTRYREEMAASLQTLRVLNGIANYREGYARAKARLAK